MHRLSISVDDELPICTFLHMLQKSCCFNNFTCLTISSNQNSQQITNRKKANTQILNSMINTIMLYNAKDDSSILYYTQISII